MITKKNITNEKQIEKIKEDINKKIIKDCEKHIKGNDQNSDVYKQLLTNMIILTGEYPKYIHNKDSIYDGEEIFNKKYDYICINPPFSMNFNFDKNKIINEINKSFVGTDKKNLLDVFPIMVGGKNSEWVFTIMTIQKLKIGGKAAIVIPENSHLSETSGNYDILRKLICKTCEIHKIIRCPRDTFTSTSASTIILFFTKRQEISNVLDYEFKKVKNIKNLNKGSCTLYSQIKSYVFNDETTDNVYYTDELNFYNFNDFKNYTMDNIINGSMKIDDVKPVLTIDLETYIEKNCSFMYDDYIDKKDVEIKENGIEYKKISEIVTIKAGDHTQNKNAYCKGDYNVIGGGVGPCGKYTKFNTPANTVLCSGAGNAGYISLYDKPVYITVALSLNINNDKELNYKYLYYYLKLKEKYIQSLKHGSLIPVVNKNDLNNIDIPIIPIEKQNEIINYIENEIINNYDIDKINKYFDNTNIFNYLLKGELEQFKQIYDIENEIINNYDIDKINKSFDNTIKAVIYNYTKDCKNIKKISDIYNVKYGTRLIKENCTGSGYPVYGGGATPKGFTNKYNTPKNTIIMAGVTAGYVNYIDTPCWISDFAYSFNLKNNIKNIDNKYVFYILKSMYNYINKLTVGSMQKHINIPIINELEIPIISLENQQKLVSFLDNEYNKIFSKSERIELLKNYIKSLGIIIYNDTKELPYYILRKSKIYKNNTNEIKYDTLEDYNNLLNELNHIRQTKNYIKYYNNNFNGINNNNYVLYPKKERLQCILCDLDENNYVITLMNILKIYSVIYKDNFKIFYFRSKDNNDYIHNVLLNISKFTNIKRTIFYECNKITNLDDLQTYKDKHKEISRCIFIFDNCNLSIDNKITYGEIKNNKIKSLYSLLYKISLNSVYHSHNFITDYICIQNNIKIGNKITEFNGIRNEADMFIFNPSNQKILKDINDECNLDDNIINNIKNINTLIYLKDKNYDNNDKYYMYNNIYKTIE